MAKKPSQITPITLSPFWACVRITRPWNVLMVGISMALIHSAWVQPGLSGLINSEFLLLAAIMMILAASGNVINDYFDVAEDLVNKPHRALVGRVVSRRTALMVHHFMVGTALSMALALSIDWHSPTPLLWSAFIAGLLWLYSPQFKRRFLRGNIVVALIVGQLPIWCTLEAFNFHTWHDILDEASGQGLIAYALLSTVITFLREVTKDLQDITGDSSSGYDTLPVRWGSERTLKFLKKAHLCTWPLLVVAAILSSIQFSLGTESLIYLLPFAGANIQLFRGQVGSVSAWQKLTLGGGLAFLCFLI
jgi:4-hydroxybenzoate polyprenyltransferase